MWAQVTFGLCHAYNNIIPPCHDEHEIQVQHCPARSGQGHGPTYQRQVEAISAMPTFILAKIGQGSQVIWPSLPVHDINVCILMLSRLCGNVC